jgi:hypothetical protein
MLVSSYAVKFAIAVSVQCDSGLGSVPICGAFEGERHS